MSEYHVEITGDFYEATFQVDTLTQQEAINRACETLIYDVSTIRCLEVFQDGEPA